MAAADPVVTPEIGQLKASHEDEDSLLECLSCNEQEGYLINPKTLQCRHTFCASCLDNHCVSDVITCYKCGEKTVSSIEDLPSALTKPTFCGTCEEVDKIKCKTANMYCVDCDTKYCAAHVKVHESLIRNHQMITIQNYRKSSYAQEMRFCETHKDRILSLGCRKCWITTCAKCLTSSPSCVQVRGTGGDNQHNLASIEEVAEQLREEVDPLKSKAEIQIDEIAALVKEITILLSDWDTETEHAVRLIHQTRDQQIAGIRGKYVKLESDYAESRKACKERITSYMTQGAGLKLSNCLRDLKTLSSKIPDLHPVDLVSAVYNIKELVTQEFPVLHLSKQTKPSPKEAENREVEIELLPVDDVAFGDKIGLFKIPPSSLQLVREVSIGTHPSSVCHYKGYTYVGRFGGIIDRVDGNGNVTSPFISHTNHIISVRVYEDQLYILVYGSPFTVYVHDLSSGKQLRTWNHTDDGGNVWGSRLVLANNQLITVNRSSNKQIVIYESTDGSVIKTISCPQITGHYITMCEGGGNSVVISDYGSHKVFKLNLTTEVVEWTSTHVQNPEGATLLGPHHVAVSHYGAGVKVWILSLHTGEMVRELTDASITNTSLVFDLYLDGDILILPRWNYSKIRYYKLK